MRIIVVRLLYVVEMVFLTFPSLDINITSLSSSMERYSNMGHEAHSLTFSSEFTVQLC